MGKNQILWKLTSLEWVSAYIAFTYFFFALLGEFKSTMVKPKLRVSLYLLTVSLLSTSLLVTIVTEVWKQEEVEEVLLDYKSMIVNGMLKGGFLVLAMVEMGNIKDFDHPSWTVLILFDAYLTGWYCFVQYMCWKGTGSYGYPLLNGMRVEELVLVTGVLMAFNVLIKYLVISLKPRPVVKNNIKKSQ